MSNEIEALRAELARELAAREAAEMENTRLSGAAAEAWSLLYLCAHRGKPGRKSIPAMGEIRQPRPCAECIDGAIRALAQHVATSDKHAYVNRSRARPAAPNTESKGHD